MARKIKYGLTGTVTMADGTVEEMHMRSATGVVDRFLGLMGQKRVEPGTALVFLRCTSIHCFWMRTPIDVLWLGAPDAEGRCTVTGLTSSLAPWRLDFGPKGSWGVAELAPGTFRETPKQLACKALAGK